MKTDYREVDSINRRNEYLRDSISQRSLSQRDVAYLKLLDKYQKFVILSNQNIAKKIDTANFKAEILPRLSLIDSANRQSFSLDNETDAFWNFRLQFGSSAGVCAQIKLKIDVLAVNNTTEATTYLFTSHLEFPSDIGPTDSFGKYLHVKKVRVLDRLIVYIHGSYSNQKKNQTFPYSEVREIYLSINHSVGIMGGERREELIKFVEEQRTEKPEEQLP